MRKRDKAQYFFVLLFSMLALLFLVGYNFVTFSKNNVSYMNSAAQNSLAKESKQLDAYISEGMNIMRVTSKSVDYMLENGADSTRIKDYLTSITKWYSSDIDNSFSGLYGVFFDGEYIDGLGWKPEAGYDPYEREWYKAAVAQKGESAVVSPYLDAMTGDIMISFSQLLDDGKSVLSLDVKLDKVQAITEEINLADMGYGMVIDSSGLVIAHANKKEKGKNYREDEDTKELVQAIYEKDGRIFKIKLNGELCTVFSEKVHDSWYVAMIIRNTKLYSGVRTTLFQNAIVSAIVFVLIAIFCTWAFRMVQIHLKKIEEGKKHIELMTETVMSTLAKAIDAKDRYTNGHSQRVAKYSKMLAEKLGKSEEEQTEIYYAALLHDVGKIRIPDTIINKPARLTDEEFAYIKLHLMSGYYILRDIKENSMIAQAAKSHHERYDGKGYPNGLAGENIPEVARIVGVADSYDAMTSNRSYRPVMPQSEVRAELEKGRGTQFDPEVADAMLDIMRKDEFYELRQKNYNSWNIVAVDDEPMNLRLIEHAMKDEPTYHLHCMQSGQEALDSLKEIDPDLILLDVVMQGLDGFETYKRIRKVSDVPVVFLTADRSIETIEKATKLGVIDYIAKPFMPQALLEVIHNILQTEIEV